MFPEAYAHAFTVATEVHEIRINATSSNRILSSEEKTPSASLLLHHRHLIPDTTH